MSLAVVDMLEMIDVDIEQRDRAVGARFGHPPANMLGKCRPVRQVGERIMHDFGATRRQQRIAYSISGDQAGSEP